RIILAGRPWFHDLIAGRKDCDLETSPYQELCQPDSGSQRNVLHLQHRTCPEYHGAGLDVLAREAPIGAGLQAFWDDHATVLDGNVFLHEDGVGPFWHRRAGKDSNGFTGMERGYRFCTGGEPARNA